jgi:hypothetical protein
MDSNNKGISTGDNTSCSSCRAKKLHVCILHLSLNSAFSDSVASWACLGQKYII